MYATNYHRASSTEEAAELFGKSDNAKFLGGGQTLLPTMKQRLADPADLIDLAHIEAMHGITIDGDKVTIGAGTTHATVESSKELAERCPSITDLAGMIGDPAVRHLGTIGGSIANNDPAADYPAAMLALNARIMTSKRTLDADDFFTGMFDTALEENEIVTAVTFSVPEKGAYEKFRNPASRYAMCGVFVAKNGDGSVRVAVTGAGADGVFRHREMEEKLSGDWSADAIEGCAVDAGEMLSDIHGDGEYRANLVKVMAARAIAKAG